jgi:hypothetical protein
MRTALQTEKENTIKTVTTPVVRTLTGRELFSFLFNDVNNVSSINPERGESVRTAIQKNGTEVYEELKYPEYFDHYFRHLYRIIKFVDKSELIEGKHKYEYIGMVRATLSRYELVWLFYNCLSGYGKEKFKPLIEQYAILKNLRTELLVDESHRSNYKEDAYNYAR